MPSRETTQAQLLLGLFAIRKWLRNSDDVNCKRSSACPRYPYIRVYRLNDVFNDRQKGEKLLSHKFGISSIGNPWRTLLWVGIFNTYKGYRLILQNLSWSASFQYISGLHLTGVNSYMQVLIAPNDHIFPDMPCSYMHTCSDWVGPCMV